ncbi:MAG: carboxypeptidase-like regulatory domain-containing protein, partial [Terracidiphilus sp.]
MPPPAGSGVIEGVVMNRDQEVYEGARVELSLSSEPAPRQTTTDSNGRFRFAGLPAGNFTAVVSAAGFKTAKVAGILRAGESLEVPAIVLSLAETSTDVEVSASRQEIAT